MQFRAKKTIQNFMSVLMKTGDSLASTTLFNQEAHKFSNKQFYYFENLLILKNS